MLFEKRSVSLTSPPDWLVEYLGGGPSYSGENVTVEKSITVPAVMAGFTILAEDTASLPLIIYRRLTRGKERASDHPLYALLHDEPNPEMTSVVFRELIMGHMLGWGNFYAQKIWDGRGVVRELWPLNPSLMEVGRKGGQRIYLYRKPDSAPIPFTQEDILHIPAFGFDGLKGLSRIAQARNSIGLAISAEKYGGRVFKSDARPGVALMRTGKPLSDEARVRLVESWNQAYSGSENAGKTALLEEGMDLKTIGFPPEDAQFIESRKFSIQEIARVFRIPPHMLGDVEKSTSWGSGIEQQELGYVTHTLRPWTVRIEQQLKKDLLLEREKPDYFFQHLFDEMLRSDTLSRMQAYAIAITNGILTRNEVREAENRLPYEGGDEPLHPLNMTSDSALSGADAQSKGIDDEDEAPMRDLTPLLMDAMRRIAKRDENELSGALKRYQGKPDKMVQWTEEFYKRDYPQFIMSTLQPYVDSKVISNTRVKQFVQQMTDARGNEISNGLAEPSMDPEVLLIRLQEATNG